MRLDLFLKLSRLCPRRTIAQKICEAGRVSINGRPAKPSHDVKTGDEIEVRTRTRIQTVRVLSIPTTRQTSRKEASGLYQLLREENLDDMEQIQASGFKDGK